MFDAEATLLFRRRCIPSLLSLAVLYASALVVMPLGAQDEPRGFPSPEEAVAALKTAASARDDAALRAIFGPAIDQIQNPDQVQANNDLSGFSASLNEVYHLDRESTNRIVLEIGENRWPFSIPLVMTNGQWRFDTAAGVEELLNRRIGKNELETLASLRAYVAAQREYAGRDRNGDEVLEFAQRITSSPGKKDGLYWPPELDGEISPLGPLFAEAQATGYFGEQKQATAEPFHGYFFKILTRQGKNPPGGKYNYIINGHMIGGFAMVAWPAEYGQTGVMTFVVNQQGKVLQKDLGPKSAKTAAAMKEYNPDVTWTVSAD